MLEFSKLQEQLVAEGWSKTSVGMINCSAAVRELANKELEKIQEDGDESWDEQVSRVI